MHHKLPRGLYALIDDGVRPDLSLNDRARAAIEGGAGILQLRLEHTADRPALALIRDVVTLARRGSVLVIVNDRVDLALAGGADGVHLGADDLPVSDARKLLGPTALIGATTRNLEQIQAVQAQGADHVGLGPIFATSTKTVDHEPLGLELVARICQASPLPVVGIAGIGLSNIGQVAQAQVHCAAVASGLVPDGAAVSRQDLVSRVRALQRAFFEAR